MIENMENSEADRCPSPVDPPAGQATSVELSIPKELPDANRKVAKSAPDPFEKCRWPRVRILLHLRRYQLCGVRLMACFRDILYLHGDDVEQDTPFCTLSGRHKGCRWCGCCAFLKMGAQTRGGEPHACCSPTGQQDVPSAAADLEAVAVSCGMSWGVSPCGTCWLMEVAAGCEEVAVPTVTSIGAL